VRVSIAKLQGTLFIHIAGYSWETAHAGCVTGHMQPETTPITRLDT
jgi:hypothetical protein